MNNRNQYRCQDIQMKIDSIDQQLTQLHLQSSWFYIRDCFFYDSLRVISLDCLLCGSLNCLFLRVLFSLTLAIFFATLWKFFQIQIYWKLHHWFPPLLYLLHSDPSRQYQIATLVLYYYYDINYSYCYIITITIIMLVY